MKGKIGLEDFKVFNEVISDDNVLKMAELIGLKSLKFSITWLGYKAVGLYKALYKDVWNKDRYDYAVSNAYDLVQSIALFLCQYRGHYANELICKDLRGKVVSIEKKAFQACGAFVREIHQDYEKTQSLVSLLEDNEPRTTIEEQQSIHDWSKYDTIVNKMNLDEELTEYLDHFMATKDQSELRGWLGVSNATLYRRKCKLRAAYIVAINDLDW